MIIGSGVNRVIGRDPNNTSKLCKLGTEGGAPEQGIRGGSVFLPRSTQLYVFENSVPTPTPKGARGYEGKFSALRGRSGFW